LFCILDEGGERERKTTYIELPATVEKKKII